MTGHLGRRSLECKGLEHAGKRWKCLWWRKEAGHIAVGALGVSAHRKGGRQGTSQAWWQDLLKYTTPNTSV